jgi:hypothetical protein
MIVSRTHQRVFKLIQESPKTTKMLAKILRDERHDDYSFWTVSDVGKVVCHLQKHKYIRRIPKTKMVVLGHPNMAIYEATPKHAAKKA